MSTPVKPKSKNLFQKYPLKMKDKFLMKQGAKDPNEEKKLSFKYSFLVFYLKSDVLMFSSNSGVRHSLMTHANLLILFYQP